MLAVALVAPAVSGQQPAVQNTPRVGYVYPAGGQQGTTVQVVVGGQFLNGTFDALISDRGVRASVVNVDQPLNAQQTMALRDQIQSLQPKAAADPAIRQQLAALRVTLGDTLQRNRNPVLADRVTLNVTIAPDAEPGPRHLRLRSPLGVSPPLVFVVGQLPEVRERDVKTTRADAELAVTLPVTANGRLIPGDVDNVRQPLRQATQYMPGDVDRYRFAARAGQHLVVAVSARDLTPYLADAVPGWFQAVVTLYDANGHEVAFCDDYRFRPDPVLHFEIPADGEYVVEIRDAIYRGREDFVYRVDHRRIAVHYAHLPVGRARRRSDRRSKSPAGICRRRRPPSTAEKPLERSSFPCRQGALESNRVPFAVGTLPEKLEREPNNARTDAQAVSLPIVINGRIASAGDSDVFSFHGRAGEAIVAEVIARRLDSPLDSVVELTDARGQRVAWGDDREDKGEGLATHHADAYVMAKLPAEGTYYVRLADIQHKGGPEYGYRLRLSAPQPDFELRVTPSTINAVNSANVPVTVTAIRRDGFAGDIALSLKDTPAGFMLTGGLIPAGQDRVRVTVTAPPVATSEPDRVRFEGRATINGKTISRDAVPADDRQQAFAYHHLVETDDLHVSVAARGGTRYASAARDAAAREDTGRREGPHPGCAAACLPGLREHPVRNQRAARGHHTFRGRGEPHSDRRGIHTGSLTANRRRTSRQPHRRHDRRARAGSQCPGTGRPPTRSDWRPPGHRLRNRPIKPGRLLTPAFRALCLSG